MISDILLNVFFLDNVAHVDLLGLFKFILFLLFYIFLHNCIYLSTGHVILDLLGKFVKNAFVLYHHSQQSLLKLIICQTDLIVFVYLFILREVPKDFGELLCVGY